MNHIEKLILIINFIIFMKNNKEKRRKWFKNKTFQELNIDIS